MEIIMRFFILLLKRKNKFFSLKIVSFYSTLNFYSIFFFIRYERVFRFLLRVHYVQLELQECWLIQMQGKEFGLGRQNEAKWQLRTHLAFLIDNLQYYLQVSITLFRYKFSPKSHTHTLMCAYLIRCHRPLLTIFFSSILSDAY